MQTRFTEEQLATPDIARADDILRKCVHCGFCTATCPTYLVTGDERDSPRGRIWLIRELLEGKAEDPEVAGHHLDRCLTCLSCMSTCPSGVDYMHLADIGRRHAAQTRKRPYFDRLIRKVLVEVLSRRMLAYIILLLASFIRPFSGILPRRIAAMLKVAPASFPRLDRTGAKDNIFYTTKTPARARVAMLAGCAQRAIDPDINAATIRLLNRLGVDVVVRKGASCCGALAHHGGDETAAHDRMSETIRAWSNELRYRKLDAIVVNASGCGTTVKDYGDAFRHDSTLAEEAAKISSLALDITEFIDRIGLGPIDPTVGEGKTVTYHSACSMQHGQRIRSLPKELLGKAGFSVREPAESHICCGSAGIYNALQPEISQDLQKRKIANLDASGGDIVAAGNLGCINQMAGAKAPVVHTIELLDWATGGPKPRKLR